MIKNEMIAAIAKRSGLTKNDSKKALEAMIAATEEAVAKGKKVELVGFGNFKAVQHKARNGRNPQTGEKIIIPARTVVKFSAGREFASKVK